MSILITISFAFLLLMSIISEFKDDVRLSRFRDYLVVILALSYFLSIGTQSESNDKLLWITVVYLTGALVLSMISRINNYVRFLIPILLLPLFVFVENPLIFGEYKLFVGSFSALIFVVIGSYTHQLIRLKSVVLGKLFGVDSEELILAITPVFAGILFFVASFFFSVGGIFLVSLGLWISVLTSKGEGKNLALFSLGALLVFPLMSLGKIDFIDITLGKTIEGLLFGAFIVLFVERMSVSSKFRVFSPVLALIISILLLVGLLLLGTQKTDLGGVDAFIAAIFGMSLMFLSSATYRWKTTVFLAVILVGVAFVPAVSSNEMNTMEESMSGSKIIVSETKDAVVDPFSQEGLDLSLFAGDFIIDETTTQLTFELGPKGGRTKGKFKVIKGSVLISKDVDKSNFSITLPVSGLSTFNKFRDESLMEETYFNLAKFPSIEFQSSRLKAKGDGYELQGKFTMLGVTKNQIVQLKLVEGIDNKAIKTIIGKGTIDRTIYGMTPDPKEGNMVDFQFAIRLLP